MYCPNCGEKLPPSAKFCTNCGHQVRENTSSGEKVIMAFMVNKKDGLFKFVSYSLVFTNSRIIMAYVDADTLQKASQDAIETAKANGAGFFKRIGVASNATSNYHQRYFSMNPNNILNETSRNFQVYYNDIRSLKVVKGRTDYDADGTSRDRPGKVIIKTNNDKHTFIMLKTNNDSKIKKEMRNLLPIKVR